MSDSLERLKQPVLSWIDLSQPGPIKQLEVRHSEADRLRASLGREPTHEELHVAFTQALGETAVEINEQQRRDAVADAQEQIEVLQEFVAKYGGNHE